MEGVVRPDSGDVRFIFGLCFVIIVIIIIVIIYR